MIQGSVLVAFSFFLFHTRLLPLFCTACDSKLGEIEVTYYENGGEPGVKMEEQKDSDLGPLIRTLGGGGERGRGRLNNKKVNFEVSFIVVM